MLALTYEDGNCDAAGDFDKTAKAIVSGIGNYFGITPPISIDYHLLNDSYILESITPNPISSFDEIVIKFKAPFAENIKLELFDISGNKINTIFEGQNTNGSIKFSPSNLRPGMYIFRLITKYGSLNKSFVLI